MWKVFFALVCSSLLPAQNGAYFHPGNYPLEQLRYLDFIEAFSSQQALSEKLQHSTPHVFPTNEELLLNQVISDLMLKEPYALQTYFRYSENFAPEHKPQKLNFPLAQFYVYAEEYKLALQRLNSVQEKNLSDSKRIAYHLLKAYTHIKLNQLPQAKNSLDVVEKSGKFKEEITYLKAHYLYASKQYSEAKSAFEKLEQQEKYRYLSAPYLMQIYFYNQEYSKAIEKGVQIRNEGKFPEIETEAAKIIGESYFKMGNYRQATPYLEEYLQKQKKPKPEDWYQLGYVYYAQNQFEKAIAHFNKIVGATSALGQNAYYQLGNAYLKNNQKQEALVAFKAASGMNWEPKTQELSLYQYGKLSYDIGNAFESPSEVLQRFLKTFPKSTFKSEVEDLLLKSFLKTKNYAAALSLIDQLPKNQKMAELRQQVALNYGLQLFRNRQLSEAKKYLEQAIEPRNNSKAYCQALFWAAEANFRLQNFSQAQTQLLLLEGVNTSFPEKSLVPYQLGHVYLRQKSYLPASRAFERYLSDNPTEFYEEANHRLADAYAGMQQLDKALLIYKQLPSSEEVDFKIAQVYGYQNNFKEKAARLEDFVRKYPKSKRLSEAYFELGNLYQDEEKYAKAIENYNQVIKIQPNNDFLPLSMIGKAVSTGLQGNTESAITQLNQVATQYAKTGFARQAVQAAKPFYFKLKQINEYEKFAQRHGVTIATDDIEIALFEAAQQSFRDKKYTTAAEEFQAFLSKYPKSSFYAQARYYQAESLYQTGNVDAAITPFTEVASMINERQEDALLRLSQIYLSKKNYASALLSLEALLEITKNPEYESYATRELLYIYARDKNYTKATKMAEKILADKSASAELKEDAQLILARAKFLSKSKDAETAFVALEKSKNPKIKAEALYVKGYFLHQKNKFETSNKVLFDMINQFPEQQYWGAKALVIIAANYFELEDPFQAHYILKEIKANYQEFTDVMEEVDELLKKHPQPETNENE